MKGLSPRNLKYMRALAEAWPEEEIVQAPLAQLTWFHNLTLLEKLKDRDERLWYARAAIENGWSRNVLVIQIEAGLHRRQGKAITNFTKALPAPQPMSRFVSGSTEERSTRQRLQTRSGRLRCLLA